MPTNSHYILLVDDDASNLFLLEEILQAEGYEVVSASSGYQALEFAQKSLPELIVLDIMMPGMDGFEVCQHLRNTPSLQTVPIIFLTALDDDSSRLKGLQVMGDDYLTKPIDTDLLLTKIASTLRLYRLRQKATQVETRRQVTEQVKRQMEAAWTINQALTEKFRLFVPEALMQRIAPKGVESIQLGNATEEEVSVLLCDIRDFTAITETQPPSETIHWLNEFFSQMSQAIDAHSGFIDKFMGDALLAVFDRNTCHATDALQAAATMQQQIAGFNQDHQAYHLQSPLRVGIGIHTGKAAIGALGSQLRMEPTVIGDVVNTASRLEHLTKVYGCPLIASETTIAALTNKDGFCYRWLDRVIPTGKQEALDLYEILGTSEYVLDPIKVETQATYEAAVEAWHQGNYEQALATWEKICDRHPQDPVAAYHKKRCQGQLQAQQHPKD
nr:response regulator [Geitlerinema sp. PCC 9228]